MSGSQATDTASEAVTLAPAGRPPDVCLPRLLKSLIDGLGWNQAELVRRYKELFKREKEPDKEPDGFKKGFDEGKLSKWLRLRLRPSEDELVWVGVVIHRGYLLRAGSSGQGLETQGRSGEYWTLCALINALLNAAGYAAIDAGRTNQTWNTITRPRDADRPHGARKIYFGWTPLKYYCDRKNVGFAFDLGDTVARMLNFEPVWVHYPYRAEVFRDMTLELRAGVIDAIGPFLFHIPSREVDLLFTDSIGFMERFVVIAGLGRKLDDVLQQLQQHEDGTHELVFVPDDASEVMGSILLPSVFTAPYQDEGVLLDVLLREPCNEHGRLRCFVTGAIDAERILEDRRYRHLAVRKLESKLLHAGRTKGRGREPYTFYLPTAFAVRDSEPKLVNAINNCLRILKDNGYIYQYLRSRHGASFEGRVMWEDDLAREVGAAAGTTTGKRSRR